MRKSIVALVLSVVAVSLGKTAMAIAQAPAQPDFDLAYVLATASYCAYAVGELDPDHGQARAVACLNAAVKSDSAHLARLKVGSNDVEAYFNPLRPENAYLLIREQKGVILAFRGTMTPPISPASGSLFSATKEALKKYNEEVAKALGTFAWDWINSANAKADPNKRHTGFDEAWQELKAHLLIDCGASSASVPSVDCSKFRSFVKEQGSGGSDRQVFVTGHSKGGALATLAALDPDLVVGSDTRLVAYTFSAAKSLTLEGAKQFAEAARGIWRFEHENDIVPSLPPDDTVWLWKAAFRSSYAHVGRLAFIKKGSEPEISSASANMVDPPGDWTKLNRFFGNEVITIATSWFSAGGQGVLGQILNSNETGCREFVDNHFKVFANVQEVVWAKDHGAQGPIKVTETNLDQSFFATGLSSDQGEEILWGFHQWCNLAKVVH
jgi:hypothetical protein